MNQIAHPLHILARIVLALVTLFGASARCVLRIAGLRGRTRRGFALLLSELKARGFALVRDGEDEATVAARLARMEWIARDPWKAMVRLCRRARGWRRGMLGCAAPPSFAPAVLACASLADGVSACALAPDT